MKIVGFVPAKGNSSRLPNKNKRKILAVPIFLWAANNLARVLPKEDIYIDSDDIEILKLAKKNGFNTIKRPETLASNDTDGNQLLEWEVSNVEADIYIQHLPPMIFCKRETIQKGIQAIFDGYETAVYVYKEKNYIWKNNTPAYDINNIPNSFDLESTTTECMGLYVVKGEAFKKSKKRINQKYKLINIDHFEKNDIDYSHDLIQSEALAEYFKKNGMRQYCEGIEKINGNF